MISFARATTTVLAVTLAAAMNACGSTEATPAGHPTSTQPPITWSLPPDPQYSTLTQQELTEVLLDISDLPANYIKAPSTASDWLDRSFCNDKPPHAPTVRASGAHLKDGGRPGDAIRTGIWQYATKEEATSSFETLKVAVQSCRRENSDGRTYRYEVAQLPAGNMYRTVAIRVTQGGTTTLRGFATDGSALVTVEIGELTPANEWRNGMTAAAYDGGRLVQLIEKQISHYQNRARRPAD